MIDFHNQQVNEELFPLYQKMLDIFKENYFLAEESTKNYYKIFMEYVELWKRQTAKAAPWALIEKRVPSANDRLAPFFADIQMRFQELRKKVNSGE